MNRTDDLDALISDALHARADQLATSDLTPADPPRGDSAGRPSWAVPLLAAAAVAAVAVGSTVVIRSVTANPSQPGRVGPGASSTSSGTPSSSGTPTSAATGTASGSQPSGSPTLTVPPAGFTLGYQPLWPFADYAQASSWLTSYRVQGSQPWHSDAGQTALMFTRNYLGFTDITQVTSSRTDAQGAHVGVGYRNPAGALATAAVLHLVRYGPAADSGWEVVGSDDTTFSLEQPGYGSAVSSPITAGGHVTGVDESIRLAVRNQAGQLVGGPAQPIPAGGQDQPWHGTVSFTGSGVLTIVASTGGHLQAVERFAIQGVHS
ncbi:MAG TPA: hypothetical protein VFD94_06745 [Jatrophihabitans sp.]|nr:hypothetical protein [Jatrophihabitans sp.]